MGFGKGAVNGGRGFNCEGIRELVSPTPGNMAAERSIFVASDGLEFCQPSVVAALIMSSTKLSMSGIESPSCISMSILGLFSCTAFVTLPSIATSFHDPG
jgi:hypothetical protein